MLMFETDRVVGNLWCSKRKKTPNCWNGFLHWRLISSGLDKMYHSSYSITCFRKRLPAEEGRFWIEWCHRSPLWMFIIFSVRNKKMSEHPNMFTRAQIWSVFYSPEWLVFPPLKYRLQRTKPRSHACHRTTSGFLCVICEVSLECFQILSCFYIFLALDENGVL